MEIKGSQEELERFFKKRKRKELGLLKSYRELEPYRKKNLIVLGLVCGVIILTTFMVCMIWNGLMSSKYITQDECSLQVKNFVIENIGLAWYKVLWLKIIPYIPALVIAVVLGWVIHGVGFRII